MMPAGKYYIGDLCYVMNKEWNECCDLFFVDGKSQEGEFTLKDGRRFACFDTKYGDGTYYDRDGKAYDVDSGSIGCILVDDISKEDQENIGLGQVFEMVEPFESYRWGAAIHFDSITINTDDYPSDQLEGDYIYDF